MINKAVVSRMLLLDVIEVRKRQLKPAFAHLNEIKLLEDIERDIMELEGGVEPSLKEQAEAAKINAEKEKDFAFAKLYQSRARRNVTAMGEKFVVMAARVLREDYYWSRARITNFIGKFGIMLGKYDDGIPRTAKQNEEDAVRYSEEFYKISGVDVDKLFEFDKARKLMDEEEEACREIIK